MIVIGKVWHRDDFFRKVIFTLRSEGYGMIMQKIVWEKNILYIERMGTRW